MQLRVLGSSGTAPAPGNPASGYLVRTDSTTLWLDAGPGTYMRLLEIVPPDAIDAVLLSHMHPDHCTDLFALFQGLKYVTAAEAAVPVVAPDGTRRRIEGFLQAGADHAIFDVLAIHEAQPGDSFVFGDIAVTAQAAHHSVAALAFRMEAGSATLGYTGDTGPSDMVAAHLADVDVLLAEASLAVDDDYPFHLNGRTAAEMAQEARAKRLILTHIPASRDPEATKAAAASTFAGEISLAWPGDVYMI